MKKTNLVVCLLILCNLLIYPSQRVTTVGIDWQKFLAQHDMFWTSFNIDATTNNDSQKQGYYSGAIMGNGLIGTNFYKLSDKVYRLNASRSDITEVRQPFGLNNSARLPVGYFTLSLKGNVIAEKMRLSIYDAISSGNFTTDQGSVKFKTYVHALKNYIIFETESSGADTAFTWSFVPQKAVSPRYVFGYAAPAGYLDANNNSNPVATTIADGDYKFTVQKLLTSTNGPVGKVYVVAYKEVKTGLKRRIIATISQENTEQAAINVAKSTIDEAFALDAVNLENEHKTWWHNFYPKSFVAFPNTKFESFYWIQLYKFASATRQGKPIVDLQGPWANYNTPWPAVWNNLNIQLTYSWQVKANQTDLTKPLWESLNLYKNNLHRNVTDVMPPLFPDYDQSTWTDAICLGRASSYDFLAPVDPSLASINNYEVGNLTWLLYYYWQYCTSTGDTTELTTRFFPLLKDAVNLYFHIRTGKDANGKWNLPPTASPEYQSTNIGANTNYDLSILRWGLKTLLAINDTFQLKDSKQLDWKDFLDNLADYPVDNLGYKVSSTVSFTANTHRHYSHLFMIYPFHLVDWENPSDYTVMNTSVNNWNGNQGYSRTGKAAMLASRGDGDGALSQMTIFFSTFIKPNTLYAETGPVFETPMAAVSTLHEFYLQDWGNRIRVFPAMPSLWTDASFINLRAEGAFLVSATRKSGKTVFIQVESEAGGLCRLQTGIIAANLAIKTLNDVDLAYTVIDANKGVIEVNTKPGDLFHVTDRTQTVSYPAPIEHPAGEVNPYGVNSGPDISIQGLVLNPQKVDLTESSPSVILQPDFLPQGVASVQLLWKSSNENVVKVNNGLVMAVAPGDALITATTMDGQSSDTCSFHVSGTKYNYYVSLPEADSYVYDGSSGVNLNYGKTGLVAVKVDGTGYNRMGFYKFSLADMDNCITSTDSTEVKVSIYVNTTGTSASSVNWQFYKVQDYSWLENNITWANKPTVSAEMLASSTGFNNTTGTYNVSNRLSIDISNAAWLQYKAGKKLISFNATQSAKASGGAGMTMFASKESIDSKQLPFITIRRIPKSLVSQIATNVMGVFQVYPQITNINNNYNINIFAPSATQFRVLDVQGRILKVDGIHANETKTISFSNYKKGIYFVVIGDKPFKIIHI